MQNNESKIDENILDVELAISDAYGKSTIFCNLFTCQKLLKDTNQEKSHLYKGHKIYIEPSFRDFTYEILPVPDFDWMLKKFNKVYEYKGLEDGKNE
jgi:hypothetical protein